MVLTNATEPRIQDTILKWMGIVALIVVLTITSFFAVGTYWVNDQLHKVESTATVVKDSVVTATTVIVEKAPEAGEKLGESLHKVDEAITNSKVWQTITGKDKTE